MTQAELEVLRVAARAAMHRFAIGGVVEEISGPNGIRTRFAAMSMADLQSYISWLDGQIGAVVTGYRQRPIYFSPDM